MMTSECKSATLRLAEVVQGIRGDIKEDSLPHKMWLNGVQVYPKQNAELNTEAPQIMFAPASLNELIMQFFLYLLQLLRSGSLLEGNSVQLL